MTELYLYDLLGNRHRFLNEDLSWFPFSAVGSTNSPQHQTCMLWSLLDMTGWRDYSETY